MRPENFLFPGPRSAPFARFVISVPLIVLVFLAAGFLTAPLPPHFGWLPQGLTELFWFNLFLLPGVLGLYKLLTGLFERKPVGSVGFRFHEGWLAELGLGVALGGGAILAAGWLERLEGLANFSLNPEHGAAQAAPFFILLFLIAAATEELLFRGYPFQRLAESITPAGAVVVTSALFGVVHLANPFHTWISTANTMLIGAALAIAYLRTRALWLPLGIHFAWNYTQGYILGLPVSGIVVPRSVMAGEVHGAAWLTGGSYGPEGGFTASAVIAALTVYLLFSRRLKVTQTMQALSLPSS